MGPVLSVAGGKGANEGQETKDAGDWGRLTARLSWEDRLDSVGRGHSETSYRKEKKKGNSCLKFLGWENKNLKSSKFQAVIDTTENIFIFYFSVEVMASP